MNFFGLIGTGAAFANYRKAKKEYDEVKEQQEVLQAAVTTYTQRRDMMFDDEEDSSYDTNNGNAPLDGVLATTILRIGNLVGQLCRVQVSVVLTNTTDKPYIITSAEAATRVFGAVIGTQNEQSTKTNIRLEPGDTIEVVLPGTIAQVDKSVYDKLISTICDSAGKALITSCPKLNINGIETADLAFTYTRGGQASGVGTFRARYINQPGTLRYCGEAFFPK